MASIAQMSPEELKMLCPSGYSTRGKANIAVIAILLPLSLFAVSLRLYVRKNITRALWWDDLALVTALLFYISASAVGIAETRVGLGKHIMCLQPDHISRILRLGLVEEVIFSYCLAFPRLAIALLVFRVFAVSRRLRIVLFGHSIFMLGVMCSTGGALFAMCSPRRKFWNPAVPGTCWSYSSALAVGYVNGVVSVLSDFFLAFLPVLFLRRMQMSSRKKIGLAALMGLGTLAGTIAIIRTYYFRTSLDLDIPYDTAPLLILINVESGVAIIAAAIPALWPLVSRHRGSSQRNAAVNPPQEPRPCNEPNATQADADSEADHHTNTFGRLWRFPLFSFEAKSRVFSSFGWNSLDSQKTSG